MLLASRERWPSVRSWSPRCARPGGGCATSPGTCCTSTPTWASRWRCRTSSGPAPTSSPRRSPAPTGGRCYLRRWPACWSGGWACRPGARCGTGSWWPRSCRGRPGSRRRPGGRDLHRLPVRAGQFLLWRFLGGRAGPGRTRSRCPRRRGRPTADHGQGPRRRPPRVAGLRPGTRVLVEGPYGRLTGELRAGGSDDAGLRHRHHPDAGAARGSARARREVVLVYRARSPEDVIFRAEGLVRLAAARGAGRSSRSARGRRPRQLAARRRRGALRRRGAAPPGAGRRPARRVPLRARRLVEGRGARRSRRRRPPRPHPPRALRVVTRVAENADHRDVPATKEGTPMRRIITRLFSTVTAWCCCSATRPAPTVGHRRPRARRRRGDEHHAAGSSTPTAPPHRPPPGAARRRLRLR